MRDLGKSDSNEANIAPHWERGCVLDLRYSLLEQLGCGSMGVVVRAVDQQSGASDSIVAIKLMRAELRDQEELQQRFIGEAMAMRRCESRHCVPLLNMGRCEKLGPYIVMPHLQGADLGNLMATGYRPSISTSVLYILQACEALRVAHAQGIVHCDIKPHNLFVAELADGPSIQLLDFGIARCVTATSNSERGNNSGHEVDSGLEEILGPFENGTVRGSPHYLSPEQLRGSHQLNAQADIWSLGTVLYELITGTEAFCGDSLTQILRRVLNAQAPDAQGFFPGTFQELYSIITRCLSGNPAERFGSVEQLAIALEPFADPQLEARTVPRVTDRARCDHSTTLRLSRSVVASTMATVAKERGHDFFLATLPPGDNLGSDLRYTGAETPKPWARFAVGTAFVAAGLVGALLGFHYLRWPLHQKPNSHLNLQATQVHPPPLRVIHTVRTSQFGNAQAPRISRLPSGYRRDQSDNIPSAHER